MGSISNSASDLSIPIVDLTAFLNQESTVEDRLRVAQDLVSACRHVGFVYIKNHGVPRDQLEQAFAISKKFYDLPTEQKMKAPHPPGWSVHRGYSWPGLEKVSSAISATDDEEAIKQLREVQDYKVSTLLKLMNAPGAQHYDRKATKLVRRTIQANRTSGLQTMYFLNGDRS